MSVLLTMWSDSLVFSSFVSGSLVAMSRVLAFSQQGSVVEPCPEDEEDYNGENTVKILSGLAPCNVKVIQKKLNNEIIMLK